MSLTISSAGGQDPYQLLQRLNDQQASTCAPSMTSGGATANPLLSSASSDPSQAQGSAAHHHHHHGGGGGGAGGAVSKLLDLIGNALQSAQNSSSDPNQVIENTVAQLLSGQTSDSSSTTTGGTTATSAPAVATTTPTSTTPGAGADGSITFTQLLQKYGVSLDQFRQDLLSAVQDAKQGNVNPGTALQSFPQGTTVNAVA